jgi:hypothetical protein
MWGPSGFSPWGVTAEGLLYVSLMQMAMQLASSRLIARTSAQLGIPTAAGVAFTNNVVSPGMPTMPWVTEYNYLKPSVQYHEYVSPS